VAPWDKAEKRNLTTESTEHTEKKKDVMQFSLRDFSVLSVLSVVNPLAGFQTRIL